MFVEDVSYLGAMQSITPGARDRYARCLAVVHTAVPCKEELVGVKSTAVPITILRIMSDGFSVAPFAMPKKGQSAPPPKDGERAEPLFRMNTGRQPPELEVWSYVSKGMNRGPRVGAPRENGESDTPPMFSIGTGTSFVMFVNALTFQSQAATSALPCDRDWIPAMSVVELTISPRHSESCLAGRGINVKTMRISRTEIDAVFQGGIEASGLPTSAAEAMRRANDRREAFPALIKDIEVEKVSFVAPAPSLSGAYMGEAPVSSGVAAVADAAVADAAVADAGATTVAEESTAGAPPVTEFVKLFIGSAKSTAFPSCDYVDVPLACLQRQTNTKSDGHALALLDIALAMGAVNLFVVCDDRWRSRGDQSCYRGVPVVDTGLLFACLDRVRAVEEDHAVVVPFSPHGGGGVRLDMDGVELTERVDLQHDEDEGISGSTLTLATGVSYDDGVLDLVVGTAAEDLGVSKPLSVSPQKNVALALCGPGVHTSKGYAFSFNVRCAKDSKYDVPRILHGYINRAAGAAGAGGLSKKRKATTMCAE
jgi:hypothetical protein